MARTRMKIARQTLIDHLQKILDEAKADHDKKVAEFEKLEASIEDRFAAHKRATQEHYRSLARAIQRDEGKWESNYAGSFNFRPSDEKLRQGPPVMQRFQHPGELDAQRVPGVGRYGYMTVGELKSDLNMLKLAVDENLTLTVEDFHRYFGGSDN